jgi:hypothetical protein
MTSGSWLRQRHARSAVLLTSLLIGPSVVTAQAQVVSVPGDYPSIQAAINAVTSGARPSGTTINVQAGTYPEALVIANTPRSMTVRGVGGAANTVVDAIGKGAAAINVFRATGTVVIDGLTFRRGAPGTAAGGGFVVQESSPAFTDSVFESNTASSGGGGALLTSNATFTNCIIRGNTARGFGGGVYMSAGSRPVFTATDIINNASGTGGAGVGNNGAGGGVFSHDTSPTFRGGNISGNRSMFAAGGIFHYGSYELAVSSMVIEDAVIADNVSTQFSSSENPAEGGGMHIENNAIATLTRVRVINNTANTGGGLNSFRARFDVFDSIIEGNRANPTAAPNTGFGGGIAATSNNPSAPIRPGAVVNLTRTLVHGNNAPASGGGIAVFGDTFTSTRAAFSMAQSVVTNNTAQNQGGGILVNRTVATISNSMIASNSVVGGATPFGGGIEAISNTTLTVTGTTIAANTAGSLGGGVFTYDGTTFDIGSSRIYGNISQSANSGGGIYIGAGTGAGNLHDSIIADNTNYQISSYQCPTEVVQYRNNTITANTGQNDLYVSGCNPTVTNITTFNSKPTASGNNSNVPRFVHFMAAPANGTRFRLAWSVGRASSVTIGGVGVFNPATGTVEVTPTATRTYSLTATATSANGGNYGTTNVGVTVAQPPAPPPPDRVTAGDFDNDAKADIVVFRPSNATWYLRESRTGYTSGAGYAWGANGDVPVPGDYDGDHEMDFAVFRPSSNHWFILKSTTGYTAWDTYQWGGNGDVPLPGDYDGDGTTDVAVYRPSTGRWYILTSGTGFGGAEEYAWGATGDRPAPGDYDGDGRLDLAVYRPATAHWFILLSTTNYTTWWTIQWGSTGDVLVPADYDGDSRTDLAIYRPSTGWWYILRSGTGFTAGSGYAWGGGQDVPVPGDYDGDGRADVAVYRPSTANWFVLRSTTNYTQWGTYQWGATGDVPLSPPGNSIR